MLQKYAMVSQSLWRMISLIMCLVQVRHAISSLNVPGQLAKEGYLSLMCFAARLCQVGEGEGEGGGGLNSLLMASLSLKLPQS